MAFSGDRLQVGGVRSASVLLGRWSWRRLQFEASHYFPGGDGTIQRHDALADAHSILGVHFMGSQVDEARARLKQLCEDRGTAFDTVQWEPLEVLLSRCEDSEHRDIGGVPEAVVINQYGLAENFLVESGEADGQPIYWYAGRPLGRQRSDLRALRFLQSTDGSLSVDFYFPNGLSIASAEISRRTPTELDVEGGQAGSTPDGEDA